MQSQPQAAEFDIEEARRVLGDVIAPWVQDLGLSIGSINAPRRQGPPLTGSRARCFGWRSRSDYAGPAASSAVRR